MTIIFTLSELKFYICVCQVMELEHFNRTLTFTFATPVKNRASGILLENHHGHYTSHLIIIRIIISALIVKTVHNVEAWCGCKVQIGRSGIWDGPSFLTSMSWDSVGHTWSKSTSTSTSKLTNFGTFLAMVNLNFNININVTSIWWAGQ